VANCIAPQPGLLLQEHVRLGALREGVYTLTELRDAARYNSPRIFGQLPLSTTSAKHDEILRIQQEITQFPVVCFFQKMRLGLGRPGSSKWQPFPRAKVAPMRRPLRHRGDQN